MHSIYLHLQAGVTHSTDRTYIPLLCRVKEERKAIADPVAAEETVVKRVNQEIKELQESQ